MSKVDEIKDAIEALPNEDYTQLRQWFSEKDWQKLDKQIETDSEVHMWIRPPARGGS